MSSDPSDPFKQYVPMNNGPHQRLFMPVGAPSLTYHVGFWFAGNDRRKNTRAVRKYFEQALEKINTKGAFELDPLGPSGDEPSRGHPSASDGQRQGSRSESPKHIRIRMWAATFFTHGKAERLTLIAECHNEYWRATAILEFLEETSTLRPEAKAIFDLVRDSVLARGGDPAAERPGNAEHAPKAGKPEITEHTIRDAREHMVVWFESFVLDEVLPSAEDYRTGKAGFRTLTADCFCTFIGSVFWKPKVPGRPQNRDTRPDDIWRTARFNDIRPFTKQLWPIIECLQGNCGFDACAAPGPDEAQPSPRKPRVFEVTASSFLKHRAIYASSLGHPETPPSAKTGQVPVVYSLFVCFEDPWQLGRLIDTIHGMGTLRLAALRDIDMIGVAFRDLAKIRARLIGDEDIEKVQGDVEALLKLEVSWRVERSQRYWKQFQARVGRLRIERIEGFQPYDAFVDRRIGDAITFIESTGRQLSLVRKEVDLRYRLKQTDSLRRNTASITSLQEAGEKLAIIPLTYYLLGIFDKFSRPPEAKIARDMSSLMADNLKIFVAFLLPVLLVWHLERRRKKREAAEGDERATMRAKIGEQSKAKGDP